MVRKLNLDLLCAASLLFFQTYSFTLEQEITVTFQVLSFFLSHCQTHDLDIMAQLGGLCTTYDLLTDRVPDLLENASAVFSVFTGGDVQNRTKQHPDCFSVKILKSRGDINSVSRCVKAPGITLNLTSNGDFLSNPNSVSISHATAPVAKV